VADRDAGTAQKLSLKARLITSVINPRTCGLVMTL